MDGLDESFREPTTDEIVARRILSLAISLTNARVGRTTGELRRDFYPDLTDAAFRKAFRRDRERLETAGIVLREAGRRDNQTCWEIDEEASFVIEDSLTPDDALALDFLLLPVASDPTFPFARDLRHALAKIDRGFDGTSTAELPPEARARNNFLTRIEDCLARRCACRITYERADGSSTTRVVAPYGLFNLNEDTYLVAARLDDEGEAMRPHTYNLARVHAMRELSRTTYEIPVDFCVDDFRRLPFQLGETRFVATFENPDTKETINEAVADAGGAAAWAISEGLVVVSPPSLRDIWRQRLEIAAGDDAQ